jgi:hypothetical protein
MSGSTSEPEMTADDVCGFLDLMAANDIRVWLDGGWAVDACLRSQTRRHADLDIVIEERDIPHLDDLAHQRLAIHQQALDRCEALRKALATAVDVGTAHLPRFEQQVLTYGRAVHQAVPQVLVAEYGFYLEAWRQAGQALGERFRAIEAEAQQAGRALAITNGPPITWPTDPLQAPTLE